MIKKLLVPICITLAVGIVYVPSSVKAQDLTQGQTTISNNKPEPIVYNKIDFETVSYDKAPKELTEGVDTCKYREGFLYYLDANTGYTYIAVMRGQKPTGGYDIKVNAVEDIEGRANVLVSEIDPEKGTMLPQMITYPYVIIKTKLPDFSISVKNSSGEVYDYLGEGKNNIIGASWVIGNLENIYTEKDYIFLKVKCESGDSELFYVRNNDEWKGKTKSLKVNDIVSVRYALGTPQRYNGESAFPLTEIKLSVDKSSFTDNTWEDLNSNSYSNILRDKEWTINFKGKLNNENISSSNIYVVDSSGNVIQTALSLKDNNTSVKVTPYKPYKLGEKYYMFISNKLNNNNNSSLNGYRMSFQITDSVNMK